MNYNIDQMKETDWNQVARIYLEGINTEVATFQKEVPTWEEWNLSHSTACRFVARAEDKILGWVALTPVSSRCVYAGVAEISVYVGNEFKGMGVGTALLDKLVKASEEAGYWTLQAGIIRENLSSRKLHTKCGFREIGFRERLGKMSNGKWHDVILVERRSNLTGNE